MPQKAITCTVELDAYTVTCPGTLHLADRNMVYMLFHILGQTNRTKSVFATFPLNFNERMVFERTFTGVSEPTDVVDLLEDQRIKLELRQYSEVHKGGKLLACYEQTAKEFLYPTPTLTGKDGLERDVLLSRTAHFSGIDPKLDFSSTTTMQEITIPGMPAHANGLAESESEESDESSETEDEIVVLPPSRMGNGAFHEEHCVCECPRRPENMGMVVPKSRSVSPTRRPRSASPTRPPFKAGKADESIISRRNFRSSQRARSKIFLPAEGDPMPCIDCKTPHKDCIVCQAYYKVFGRDFLKHRFTSAGHRRAASTPSYTTFVPSSEPPKIRARRYVEDNDEDPELYQSRAYSEPLPRTKPRLFSTPKFSSSHSYARVSSPSEEIHDRVERIIRKHSPLPVSRSYVEESDSDDDSLLSLQELRSEINSARLESLDRSFEDPDHPSLGTRLDRSLRGF
ncbi:spermatogenesis-associated protein 6 isoform X2 [Nematostella vectensis]|uniref:spermatogenesis-associated protein 6 isoform X2 n=1 Tax=Nematostella vectensis TaxID=45351 RepID=UPI0020770A01|nr:spermatogenesis-associated protein 6 isoform X2 [Nematostella vectensis]